MPRATQVPCSSEHGCTNTVDSRRAKLGRIGAQDFSLCPWHNEANLPSHKPAQAQYDDRSASHDPAGTRAQRGERT